MNNETIGYIINEATFTPKREDVSQIGDNNGRALIETILQDGNVTNRNGRYYDIDDLKAEINAPRQQELISSGNMFGEAGHPMSKDISRQQVIDPRNMSHKIVKLWVDGNDVKAHVVGSATRVGEDFNNLVMSGTLPSFSLRALGTIKNTSKGAEVKNLKIITWDWVIYPSHKRAYMQKFVASDDSETLKESGMVLNESGIYIPQSLDKNEEGNKLFAESGRICPITNKQVIDYIKSESQNIKNIQESFGSLFSDVELMENGKNVRLVTESGQIIVVRLENHLRNQIMNYCSRY